MARNNEFILFRKKLQQSFDKQRYDQKYRTNIEKHRLEEIYISNFRRVSAIQILNKQLQFFSEGIDINHDFRRTDGINLNQKDLKTLVDKYFSYGELFRHFDVYSFLL